MAGTGEGQGSSFRVEVGQGGGRGFSCEGAHRAPRAQPLAVGDLGQRRVEAMDVVGGGAGVAAQQLATVFAHAAELHVVVVLLLGRRPSGHAHPDADLRDDPVLAVLLKVLKVLVLGLPLDSLFLLQETWLRGDAVP